MAITINRPLTDIRLDGNITDKFRPHLPQNWWTFIRSASYLTAAGYVAFPPRTFGAIPMAGDGLLTNWTAAGNYETPLYAVGDGTAKFAANIKNPGAVFTVLEIARPVNVGWSWGLKYAALELDSGVRGSGGNCRFRVNNNANDVLAGSGLPTGVRGAKATVVNLGTKEVAQAVNGGAFTVATTTTSAQLSALAEQPDAIVRMEVGRAGTGDAMVGIVLDTLLVPGDVRAMGTLWADYYGYAASADVWGS